MLSQRLRGATALDEEIPNEILRIKLPNGATIHAEVQLLDREENIASREFNLTDLKEKITGIAQVVRDAIVDLEPKSASMEFGLEIGLETGTLTALLAKGTGKANLKVKLDW
jgi:hypothetical protein